MEAIDTRLAEGRGSPGLPVVLRRMGVRYLLVRNDLDRGVLNGAWPARLHAALDTMGMRRTAAFGGQAGYQYRDAVTSVDQPYDPLEIYELDAAPLASAVPDTPLRVSGGPEALLALADQGLLDDDRPVVFTDDPSPDVVTDTFRRRELAFSDLRGGGSPTLTAADGYHGTAKVKDFVDPAWQGARSVAEYAGISGVTASSSAADVDSVPVLGARARHPFAALDGDPDTAWTSSGWQGGDGQWLRVAFTTPIDPGGVRLAFPVDDLLGPAVTSISIETAAGKVEQRVRDTSDPQVFRAPTGTTTWLRVRVTGTDGESRVGNRVAISELTVPGVLPQRVISVPGTAATLLFTGLTGYMPGCMRGPQAWACNPYLAVQSEEGNAFVRSFGSPGGTARLQGRAIMTSPELIDLSTGSSGARSSSRIVDHPAALARSAFDGDPATAWTAASDDENPSLVLDLGSTRTVSALKVRFGAERRTTRLDIADADGTQTRSELVSPDGEAAFEPLRARRIKLTFPGVKGVQVTEIEIPGVPHLPVTGTVSDACGTGPTFTVGDHRIDTRLIGATYTDLLTGRPVRYESCRGVELTAGRQKLSADQGAFLIADAALLPSTASSAPVHATPVTTGSWNAEHRTVTVNTRAPSLLVVGENFNKGWKAVLNGRVLEPTTVDGWKQAWRLPAASGEVRLTYVPDRPYRLALLGGLLLVVMVAVLAAVPSRRAVAPSRAPKAAWLPLLAPVFALWAGGPVMLAVSVVVLALRKRLPEWLIAVLTAFAVASTAAGYALSARGIGGPYTFLTEALPTAAIVMAVTLVCSLRRPEPAPAADGERTAAPELRPAGS